VPSSLLSRASGIALAALALSAAPGAHAAGGEPLGRGVRIVGSGHLNATVAVRSAPRTNARRVTVLKEFRSEFRPQTVLAVAQRTDPDTERPSWYRIVVPGRPNGRLGWIPAEAADIHPVRQLIHIDRSARRLEVWSRGRLVLRTRVAVGAPGMETPLGLFYVTWRFVPTAPVLGRFAFETSAYSRLSDWPGGGIVGIHGTYAPSLLGRAVSHGCVRVSNPDILRMRRIVPVGTPIRIVA
jgi:lipoprotein-anchoring transpeptidase ErfK/SrfK